MFRKFSTIQRLSPIPIVLILLVTSAVAVAHWSGVTTPGESASQTQTCPTNWNCTNVAAGVVWMKYTGSDYPNQVVNALDVDPAQAQLGAVMASPAGSYETVLSMGTRTNALAGVNGGFFCNYQDCSSQTPNGQDDICTAGVPSSTRAVSNHAPCPPFLPRSLLQINGTAFSMNCALRTSFGISASGTPVIQPIGASQGWVDVVDAVGAGPNLVTSGTKNITTEGFDWYTETAPRTAAAIGGNGHAILVTVDGRYTGATGMTIDTLANFLVGELQVSSAMNLDGGGSTTMYVTGKGVVNKPSGNCNRAVYDGLFAFSKSAGRKR